VEAEGQLDEACQLAPALDRSHLDRHGRGRYTCGPARDASATYASVNA
jgi:hypothetical protein